MLERYFQLSKHGTNVRTELLAGLTTFLTMAYIIFLQPAILEGTMLGMPTGRDFDAVMVATGLAAAVATAIKSMVWIGITCMRNAPSGGATMTASPSPARVSAIPAWRISWPA